MNFSNLLLWLPENVLNILLNVSAWGRDHIDRTVRNLRRVLFVNIVLLGAGLLLARAGATNFGPFLVAFAGALSMFLWLYIWIRIAVLAEAGVLGNKLASAAIREASRPLPSTPIEIPEILDDALANKILRATMAGLAAIAGASAYASIIPVYRNLTLFLTCITVVFFVAFLSYGKTIVEGKGWGRSILTGVGVAILLFNTFAFLFPTYTGSLGRYYSAQDGRKSKVMNAVSDAEMSAGDLEAQGVVKLHAQREDLLKKYPDLSEQEMADLAKLNRRIADVQAGKLLEPEPTNEKQLVDYLSRWDGRGLAVSAFWALVLVGFMVSVYLSLTKKSFKPVIGGVLLIGLALLFGPWITGTQDGLAASLPSQQVSAAQIGQERPNARPLGSFEFWNRTGGPVSVVRLEGPEHETIKGTVASGFGWKQKSYPETIWTIRDQGGKELRPRGPIPNGTDFTLK